MIVLVPFCNACREVEMAYADTNAFCVIDKREDEMNSIHSSMKSWRLGLPLFVHDLPLADIP